MKRIQISWGSLSGFLGLRFSFISSSGASGEWRSSSTQKMPRRAVAEECHAAIISCRNFISRSGRAESSQFQHSTTTFMVAALKSLSGARVTVKTSFSSMPGLIRISAAVIFHTVSWKSFIALAFGLLLLPAENLPPYLTAAAACSPWSSGLRSALAAALRPSLATLAAAASNSAAKLLSMDSRLEGQEIRRFIFNFDPRRPVKDPGTLLRPLNL